MRKQSIASISAAIALALAAGGAQAATKSDTFNVNASVAKNCLVDATDLNFAAYDGTALVDATSTVSAKCTKGTTFAFSLDGGSTGGGTISQRLLDGAVSADTLQYNLYTDASRSTLWGDGTTGVTVSDTGTGMANWIAKTVYGRIPDNATNQAAAPDDYSDVITVTVTY
jgi:spore coat protein U-like protein